jgi:hypothetical protein
VVKIIFGNKDRFRHLKEAERCKNRRDQVIKQRDLAILEAASA